MSEGVKGIYRASKQRTSGQNGIRPVLFHSSQKAVSYV
jgi:hypothetical protein